MLVCLDHPERVEQFVPMNTGHVWPSVPLRRLPKQVGGFAYQAVLASPIVGRYVGGSPLVLRSVFKLISTQTDAVLDEFDGYAARFAEPARARAAQQVYRTFQLYELPAWIRGRYRDRRLTTPTLWLHGIGDPVITPSVFRDIVDHADDVRIEYLADCGHFLPEEAPDETYAALHAFFTG